VTRPRGVCRCSRQARTREQAFCVCTSGRLSMHTQRASPISSSEVSIHLQPPRFPTRQRPLTLLAWIHKNPRRSCTAMFCTRYIHNRLHMPETKNNRGAVRQRSDASKQPKGEGARYLHHSRFSFWKGNSGCTLSVMQRYENTNTPRAPTMTIVVMCFDWQPDAGAS